MMVASTKLPQQRWHVAAATPEQAAELATATQLSPLLAQVLIHRGISSIETAQEFLLPDSVPLPSPLDEFPDLAIAINYLAEAIAQQQAIAICGDYDADGMTSTALLIRALRTLGGIVHYDIPSRMSEGYGINTRIVEDFHRDGIRLILTVDNGIAAYEPIARARELGLTVIITDHHDLPPTLPPAHAILNPKLIPEISPYRGMAGVGVAYQLALSLAEVMQRKAELETILLDLFTLGTIADLAPLTGVNRRWVQQGLKQLPHSQIPGVRALIEAAGLAGEKGALKPEAIGFRLGPRINAIGRIGEPSVVIDLLTTNDSDQAKAAAQECEETNQRRRDLCDRIERQAIAWVEATQPNLQQQRVLVVVQPEWHHGVIGIVASRLVERYGVPVFIGTFEDEAMQHIRGSARSIPEFHVFNALQFCGDALEKFGGHKAAGGFSLQAGNFEDFCLRLYLFANMYLLPEHLKPLVEVDVEATFDQLTMDLYHQIDQLHPCGMGNPDPVFWTRNVQVVGQKTVGRDRSHLKLKLAQSNPQLDDPANLDALTPPPISMTAIAWRWGDYYPLPSPIDVAYRLRLNDWNGVQSVELELIGARLAGNATDEVNMSADAPKLLWTTPPIEFTFGDRHYQCSICQHGDERELRIRNPEGKVLAVQPSQKRGLIGSSRAESSEIDVFEPFFFNLIRTAMAAVQQGRSPIS